MTRFKERCGRVSGTGGPGRVPDTAWYPGDALLWLVLLLPLTTPLMLVAVSRKMAVTQSPLLVLFVGLLLALAAWVGRDDGWLGLFVGWPAVALLWAGTPEAFETVQFVSLGALGLLAVRRLPAARKEAARLLLIAMGLFQVGYGGVQLLGIDPLWWGLAEIQPIDGLLGTLGNRGYFGWYVAAIAPLAPLWALPVFAAGALLSKSVLAVLMLTAGLGWRFRGSRWTGEILAAGAAALAILAVWRGEAWLSGAAARVSIWGMMLAQIDGWHWLIGAGPGAWSSQIVPAQVAAGVAAPVLFYQAHNEWLQVLWEAGAVGVALLVGWIWAHRSAFCGRYGGCWVALLIGSFGHFGFRLAVTGATALVLLGLPLDAKEDHA